MRRGEPLGRCRLDHAEIVAGGTLKLDLDPGPNKTCGIEGDARPR